MIAALRDAATAILRRRERRKRVLDAERRFFARVLELGPGDIAIDCGANVGSYTRHMARSGATVHAFEPDPVAFDVLAGAVRQMPNVILHPDAVGAAHGSAVLSRAADFEKDPLRRTISSTLMQRHGDASPPVTVRVVDLAQFIIDLDSPVRLLKMDIEGAEVDVLEALVRTKAIHRVQAAFVETHERQFPALRSRTYALMRSFARETPVTVNVDWG